MEFRRLLIIIGLISIIWLLVLAISFLATNSNFLTFYLSKQDLNSNNFNPSSTLTEVELTELIAQNLSVPELFQQGVFSSSKQLNLPKNFKISVYAAGMKAPRFFDFDDQNNMIIAEMGAGQILILKDRNADKVAEEKIVIDKDLNSPSSVDYYQGDLYVGEQNKVTVFKNLTPEGSYTEKKIIINNLPTAGHITRTVLVGPDNKLYVAIGSSCNVCEEQDQRRAAIVRYNLDGSGEEIYALGLRNTVGFIFADKPQTNSLWGVDMGRDLIGDDLPPEEVNIIEQGSHYGWPYCYGEGIANPEYPERTSYCQQETAFPVYQMQAHSAPLGLSFPNSGSSFPKNLNNNLLIAFHGSWNRSVPTGYKVVRIDTDNPQAVTVNFITGWLNEQGQAWGRPVGIKFDNTGVMFISDDSAGAIYRVTYLPSN